MRATAVAKAKEEKEAKAAEKEAKKRRSDLAWATEMLPRKRIPSPRTPGRTPRRTTRRGEFSEAKEPRKQAGRRASAPAKVPQKEAEKKARMTSAFAFFSVRIWFKIPRHCPTQAMWRNEREDCTVQPGVEALLLELIQRVDEVEAAVGSEELGIVRRQLRELEARSAMSALKLVDQTTKEAEKREARARSWQPCTERRLAPCTDNPMPCDRNLSYVYLYMPCRMPEMRHKS